MEAIRRTARYRKATHIVVGLRWNLAGAGPLKHKGQPVVDACTWRILQRYGCLAVNRFITPASVYNGPNWTVKCTANWSYQDRVEIAFTFSFISLAETINQRKRKGHQSTWTHPPPPSPPSFWMTGLKKSPKLVKKNQALIETQNCTLALLGIVCWFLNVPATCQCISGTDLIQQFYV